MHHNIDIRGMNDKISVMKQAAVELKDMASMLPAVDRNTARILASIKMLEISITDVADLEN
jgi:hypothetical protein